jgi:hypothetical protein
MSLRTVAATKKRSHGTDTIAVSSDDQRSSGVCSRDNITNECSTTDCCLLLVFGEGNCIQSCHVDEHASLAEVERAGPSITAILGQEWNTVLRAVFDLGVVSKLGPFLLKSYTYNSGNIVLRCHIDDDCRDRGVVSTPSCSKLNPGLRRG